MPVLKDGQLCRTLCTVSREKRKQKTEIRIPSFLLSLREKKISKCEESKADWTCRGAKHRSSIYKGAKQGLCVWCQLLEVSHSRTTTFGLFI